MKQFRSLPHKKVEITAFDGLKLRGKYFEYKKGAPIEILFHGYRGSSYRDLCGGVYRCFELSRNTLVVDHRAAGESEGRVGNTGYEAPVRTSLPIRKTRRSHLRQIRPEQSLGAQCGKELQITGK